MHIRLDAITFDAGTQIRAAIDPQVVTDYAAAMTAGQVFPPIVLFHDGNQHYLADGFHRFMAAQRNQFREIYADVRPGTKQDALWFALGANRTNGKRLSETDKTHAVAMALSIWPEKMQREIADQIGCSESLVSKTAKDIAKNTSVEPVIRGRALATQAKRAAIAEMVREGAQSIDIKKKLNAHTGMIAEVRRELGLSSIDYSRSAVKARREQMREMAAEGYSSNQIADAIGIGEIKTRQTMREMGIDVPADKVTRGTHRHDSNRIVDRIVTDAENLTADVNLVDFSTLDRDRLGEWADALIAAKRSLDSFIKRLVKEQQKHGEAA